MLVENLTPHPISVFAAGQTLKLDPSGDPVRLEVNETRLGMVAVGGAQIPLASIDHGRAINLPVERIDVLLVVSRPVALAIDRQDLVVPYPLVRNDSGMVVGCSGFARVVHPRER